MAAHLYRGSMFILMAISLLIPFILIWKSKISARILQLFFVLFGLEWIRTLVILVDVRMENGEDWMRMAIILGIVALLNFLSLLVFRSNRLKKIYHLESNSFEQ
jgi:uncharacterized membrane protein HdeD (DUF308 family)